MRLGDLVTSLGGQVVTRGNPVIKDVHLDSRRVQKACLFCALKGLLVDGSKYAAAAVEDGAAAVLATAPIEGLAPNVPLWIHPEARRIAGEAAAIIHGQPAAEQVVIGVTGTNGKSTVVHLIACLLRSIGRRPGTIGTVEVALFDSATEPSLHTTPDATELQRLARRNLEAGGDCIVLEVSSHALDQERLAGLELDVAVFTNIGHDHLDYHVDADAYLGAKEKIFSFLKADGRASINADAEHAERVLRAAWKHTSRVVTYGSGSRADLMADLTEAGPRGTHLFLEGMGISRTGVYLPLVGRHNVENALAATSAVLLLEASPSRVSEGLASVSSPKGRLEELDLGSKGFQVFVDYAHTPDALERVLITLRDIMSLANDADTDTHAVFEGRLICVFGCGGNRDREKRGPMGEVVGRLADLAIVTNDNPRHEDPLKIIREIELGLESTPADVFVEPDRRAAIRAALAAAEPGDVVLIAGKGHESWQLSRGKRLPFEDQRVVLEELP